SPDPIPHELVFPPTTDPATIRHRGNAWLFPSTTTSEWRSRDLFVPHPDPARASEGLWRFYGRVDDAVELASGAKFFPGPWEAAVRGHPRVAHCMVVGAGRSRPGVLVEPMEELVGGEEEEKGFVEEVWPVIEKANEGVAACARVERGMVRVVRPGSLVRAPKGTVIRRASGEGHREVIEGMYRGE
ncbi:hypothetical protein DIS24_g9402, partial [Lasiodiplodia hormozganensis]